MGLPTLGAGTASLNGPGKRRVVERTILPALMARGMLPQGAVSYRPGHALEHNWTIAEPDGTQHAVAVRVRTKEYGAFTVRYRTSTGRISELTKRVRSIQNGGSIPGYTVQAELGTDDAGRQVLKQAYVVRTEDLYSHFVRVVQTDTPEGHEQFTVHECTRKQPYRAPGGALFFVVAINEYGRTLAGTKSSLAACGVHVESLVPMAEGLSLWRQP